MNFVKKIYVVLLVTAVGFIAGCKLGCKKSEMQEKKPSLVVMNVLDKNLYDNCHIKGSVNVPFSDVEQYAKDLDRDTHVVTYCANYQCSASGESARKLTQMGFKNVSAYEAGIVEWKQSGLPVEGPCAVEGDSSYLTAANEKPEKFEEGVNVITTEELKSKMMDAGLLS